MIAFSVALPVKTDRPNAFLFTAASLIYFIPFYFISFNFCEKLVGNLHTEWVGVAISEKL
jgi:hypothetical protein